MLPFAFEAKVNHPSLPLDIPNLHILVRKSKDDENLWCGLCLDLSISAYSRKKTYKKIKEEILSDINKMAINMIQHHLKNGTINTLFDCSVEIGGEWQIFNDYTNRKKLERLEESYLVVQNRRKLMQALEERLEAQKETFLQDYERIIQAQKSILSQNVKDKIRLKRFNVKTTSDEKEDGFALG